MYEYKCSSSILAGEATREIPEGDIVPVLEQLHDSLVKSHSESQEKLRWSIPESNADSEKPHEPRIMSRQEDIDSFLDSL